MKSEVKLKEIAHLQTGLYMRPTDTGETFYLQAKHFDDSGNIKTLTLDTFADEYKVGSHLLKYGDVLLVAKGFRNFAWSYSPNVGQAVASSIFFVIRVDEHKILPEYLTLFLNAWQSQAYFQQLGAGSSIPSIRKSELENFKIHVPSLDMQRKIIELQHLHNQEITILSNIISEKQYYFNATVNKLIHQ